MANVRLERLREQMAKWGVDVYYIPSSDFHDSEYVEPYFKCREYVCGFTGSAGTLIVTRDFSGLWTDGRYFVQAKKELDGQDTELMKMGEEGVPTLEEFLEQALKPGMVLGFDGRVVNAALGLKYGELAKKSGASLLTDHDLVGEIWDGRPALSAPKVWILGEAYTGESAAEKLARVRQSMEEKNASVHLLSSLDDIAWLLNLRKEGSDGNLLAPAHVLLTKESAKLYMDQANCPEEVRRYLEAAGVVLCPYEGVYEDAAKLSGETVLLETEKVNFSLYGKICGCELLTEMNPSSMMKAMKNPTEMENLRKAHIRDGVALTKFIYWMKHEAPLGTITETEAAERLEEFRKEQEGYLCPSFDTISAYGPNAAMCHYHATKAEESVIMARGLYLVDSGGQYLDGTTDVTRTMALGPLTHEEKLHYTLVLMGMLRLADAKFLYGCRGINLDYLARGPLWKLGLDFNHGTGHGVGFVANVHERPNGFRWRIVPERQDSCVLEEGMFTSDEPGLYIEGSHGIRTENLLMCRKAEKNAYGQFMRFETLTLAPIDTEAIDISVMEPSDVHLLNEYHRRVYETIGPLLEEKERQWLEEATKKIGGMFTWHS